MQHAADDECDAGNVQCEPRATVELVDAHQQQADRRIFDGIGVQAYHPQHLRIAAVA